MELQGWISSAVAIIGSIITVTGFIIKVNKDRDKALSDLRTEISATKVDSDAIVNNARRELEKEKEEAHRRIYERLDSVKKEHNEEIERMRKEHTEDLAMVRQVMYDQYVNVKMCGTIHMNQADINKDFKETVEKIFVEIKEINQRLFDGQKPS